MNDWLVVGLILAAGSAIAFCVLWLRTKRQLSQNSADSSMQAEALRSAQRAAAQSRRSANALRRDLDALERTYEQIYADNEDLYLALNDVQERLEQLNRLRIQAERDGSAARMKAGLLEEQLLQLQKEQRAQEQLYQDIIRDKEQELNALREQQKRRNRRKLEVPQEQISFIELLSAQ